MNCTYCGETYDGRMLPKPFCSYQCKEVSEYIESETNK